MSKGIIFTLGGKDMRLTLMFRALRGPPAAGIISAPFGINRVEGSSIVNELERWAERAKGFRHRVTDCSDHEEFGIRVRLR